MRNLGAKYSQPFRKRELQLRMANSAWAFLGASVEPGNWLASQCLTATFLIEYRFNPIHPVQRLS